jgi:Ca2+-binding RTX toxin-like protein
MNGTINAVRIALVGGLAAVLFGAAPDLASAAYTGQLDGETLRLKGDGASDKLLILVDSASLIADVGADGTTDFTFDRSTFTAIDVDAGPGDDEVRVFQAGGTLGEESITLRGGSGDDTLTGHIGSETIYGGPGDDTVAGGFGTDTAFLGPGHDRFVWNAGDSNDTVEGETGEDRLEFNGTAIGEQIGVSANGARVRFTRNIANITLDLDGVERIGYRAFGGADAVVVDDLTGTAARSVDVDLNAPGGGGDGQADIVTYRGTEGPDRITLSSPGGYPIASGLGAQVLLEGAETTLDELTVATLGGEDTITTGRETHGLAAFNVDGGADADTARYNGTAVADEIAVFANGTETSTVAPLAARFDTLAVESLVVLGLGGPDLISGTGNLAALTAITMDGGDDADDLRGGNGPDLLLGGAGDDRVDGNQGADRAFLGTGNDRFQWDPGDGSDTVEGQGGQDELAFFGSNAGELMEATGNAGRLRFTRNIGNVVIDADGIDQLEVYSLGSADTVTVGNLAGTTLRGVEVDQSGFGGTGDGQLDNVVVQGTEGDDRITVVSAPGGVAVTGVAVETRVVGNEPTLDNVTVSTLAGADTVSMTVGVISPVTVNVDGGADEDTARYNGTAAADQIAVVANGTEVATVSGDTARFDTLTENLIVRGLGEADLISGTGNLAALAAITFDGGDGDDDLRGGNGADLLLGGNGDDRVDGNQGADRAFLGTGNDRFQWDPGDGNDVIEGQSGQDELAFFGSNAGEIMEVAANAGRIRFTRNIANIVLDADDVERLTVNTLGAVDTVTVGDLTGTNLRDVDVDLASSTATGDGQADTVIVNGRDRRDVVHVTRAGAEALVSGLPARTRIVNSEPANDTLRVQTLAGNDTVTVAPDVADLIATVVDLGPDD